MGRLFVLMFLFPVAAFAQEAAPSGDIDPLAYGKIAYEAITSGNYAVVAAALLVLVVWAFRTYGGRFFPKAKPFLDKPLVAYALPFVISALGAVVHALVVGGDVKTALSAGLKVAAEAVAIYVGGKKFAEHREEAKEAAAAKVQTTADALKVLEKGPTP